jgi:hypothetical protein
MLYKVIDNFLRNDLFFKIKNILLEETSSWKFKDHLSHPGDCEDVVSFALDLFSNNKVNCPQYFPIIEPLKHRLNIQHIYRAMANLVPLPRKPLTSGIHNDHPFPHNVLLYYINTNNGYTTLDPKGKNIKINYVENRAVIFDGSIPHSGTLQSDKMVRVNINITFK